MRLTRASGATSFDLLVAIVLWAIVSTAIVAALIAVVRSARKTIARAERRETLQAASTVVAAELRSHAGEPATLVVASHQVEYRGRRWTAVTCRWPSALTGHLHLTLRSAPFFGDRPPIAGRDSALVWLEGYPSDPTDGRWQALLVTDVSPGTCPDGRPGWAATLEAWPTTVSPRAAHPGAPVVGYERAALRLYQAGDGQHWLGQATAEPSGWKAVQPIAGPLAVTSGFAWRPDGRSIAVGLRAAGPGSDSLETVVGVRAIKGVPQ